MTGHCARDDGRARSPAPRRGAWRVRTQTGASFLAFNASDRQARGVGQVKASSRRLFRMLARESRIVLATATATGDASSYPQTDFA